MSEPTPEMLREEIWNKLASSEIHLPADIVDARDYAVGLLAKLIEDGYDPEDPEMAADYPIYPELVEWAQERLRR